MSVLLQISDPHFGTEQPAVVEALVALARQLQPDLLVLSGDITQRARPAQFQAARTFIGRLGAPVLAVPGNHDIPLFNLWARLRHPYAGQMAAFGPDLEPVHASADMLVLCVNTTRAWRHKNGQVSARQIDRVSHALASAMPAQLRVVVVHNPLRWLVPKTRRICCAGTLRRCKAGQLPVPTSSWAVTSTCPMCWRCPAWRDPSGRCRPARPCRRGCARTCPIR